MTCRTCTSSMCAWSRRAFRRPSGAASGRRTMSSSPKASSTSWRPRRSRTRSPIGGRCSTSRRAPKRSSSLPRKKPAGDRPCPREVGRGVALQFVFGSYLAQVAEVEVSKDGAVRVRRVVCAVDCGTVVNPDTVAGADPERDHLRHHRGALWRDHAEERPCRADQLRYLSDAAHERGAGHRGPHRPERGAAGWHGRGRDVGDRSRHRQCDLCRNRQAPAQDAGRRQRAEK